MTIRDYSFKLNNLNYIRLYFHHEKIISLPFLILKYYVAYLIIVINY